LKARFDHRSDETHGKGKKWYNGGGGEEEKGAKSEERVAQPLQQANSMRIARLRTNSIESSMEYVKRGSDGEMGTVVNGGRPES